MYMALYGAKKFELNRFLSFGELLQREKFTYKNFMDIGNCKIFQKTLLGRKDPSCLQVFMFIFHAFLHFNGIYEKNVIKPYYYANHQQKRKSSSNITSTKSVLKYSSQIGGGAIFPFFNYTIYSFSGHCSSSGIINLR